ncbi:MAG TPA: hypothetical protein VFE47_18270 [Tepidisphaeraceae bacterium]|nr:hypothetical protein [Tepidisphaeraceae bacterium]
MGAAAASWIFVPAKYEIVGWVRIQPYVGKILYQSDENGMLPNFDTFVDFQASLVQSQRVLDAAGLDPAWTAIGRKPVGLGPNSVKTDDLVVDRTKGSELITITATDRSEDAAKAAVASILRAYEAISREIENKADADRLRKLEAYKFTQDGKVKDIVKQIQEITDDAGTDDLTGRCQVLEENANSLDIQQQQIALELVLAEPAPTNRAPTTAPSTQPSTVVLTREDVAAIDRRMSTYLQEEDGHLTHLAELRSQLGESNSQILLERAALKSLDEKINKLLAYYQAKADDPNRSPIAPVIRGQQAQSVPQLKAKQIKVAALYKTAIEKAAEWEKKKMRLEDLKRQEAAARRVLDEATRQDEALTLEATTANRISILSYGETPPTPHKNKRGPITAAAGVGGLGSGFAIVALLGFLDRRIRSVLHIQQLEPSLRMLGVLPVLPENLEDADRKSQAAHCVHQIRNLLDTGRGGISRVFGITSSNARDGKTSLTLALGLSFATAGSRTLLIDCDIVGGGLTRRLDAIVRRDIGILLRRDKLITDIQLREARQEARSSRRKLADVLIESGYVTESNVHRAVAAAAQSSVGLLDALSGDHLSTCVSPILAKGLYILPLGAATEQDTTQVSPKAFRRILDEARRLFDVVLVDTGPILGSLEASIVVREVDDVVLTVARDGRAPAVRHAVKQLYSLGVRFAGLVFNRATLQDVAFANYGSSSSTVSIRSASFEQEAGDIAMRAGRLGSLVSAVVRPPTNGSEKATENHNAAD